MKKKLLLCLLGTIICITLLGCSKHNEDSKWKITVSENKGVFPEEVEKAFNDAKDDYQDGELIPIALLGEQIVAGTNYMFLCTNNSEYNTVIVYKNIQGESQITSVNRFNPKNYLYKNDSIDNDEIVGGWETKLLENETNIPDNIRESFLKAKEKITAEDYSPIVILANNDDDDEYAILSYGTVQKNKVSTTGVYVIRLDTKNNEFKTISQVNLAEFNK